jgi:hypothetical protein
MAAMEARVDTTAFVTPAAYPANRSVEGDVVTVMDAMHEARGLKLIPAYTRALRKGPSTSSSRPMRPANTPATA